MRRKDQLIEPRQGHQLDRLEDVVAGHAEVEEEKGVGRVFLLEEGEEVAAVQGAEGRVETRVRGGLGETIELGEQRRLWGQLARVDAVLGGYGEHGLVFYRLRSHDLALQPLALTVEV